MFDYNCRGETNKTSLVLQQGSATLTAATHKSSGATAGSRCGGGGSGKLPRAEACGVFRSRHDKRHGKRDGERRDGERQRICYIIYHILCKIDIKYNIPNLIYKLTCFIKTVEAKQSKHLWFRNQAPQQ